MTHPEIPSDCEYFENWPGDRWIFHTGHVMIFVDHPRDQGDRDIVSAMAEVAWRKIDERYTMLSNLIPDMECPYTKNRIPHIIFERALTKCIVIIKKSRKTALAWREWSKGA